MAKRTNKERDWNYYKPFLQEYCIGNLPYSNKIPPHAAYYHRKFYSPNESLRKGTGSITIFDPSNPREGTNYTMWKDWSDPMEKAGDIYALIMKNEHIQTRWEAYDRCEDLFGKAQHVVRTQAVRKRNRAMRSKKKESAFKLTNEQIALEEAKCQEQRRRLEAQIIQNLREEGSFFKTLRHIPCQVGHDREGKLVYHRMTCANYMHAMLLNREDPRYISERDAKKEGWRIREGAKPVDFEYLDTKSAPYHLFRWKLYNAADVIGMEPYRERPEMSQESVMENIKTMLKGNGIDPEQDSLMEQLRGLASQTTWNEAIVPGQRALERELVMTQLMQQAGMKEPYKVTDLEPILRHLERDLERKESRNLFRSGLRMDQAVKSIQGKYTQQMLRETMEQAKAIRDQLKTPFAELSVRMTSNFRVPGEADFIPRGAVLEGEKAYTALAAMIKHDRTSFSASPDLQEAETVSMHVAYGGRDYDLSLPMGRLHTGNRNTVAESLAEAVLKSRRDQVFTDDGRQQAVMERIQLKMYNSPDYRKAYEENPDKYQQQEELAMLKEFREVEKSVEETLAPLLEEESRYIGNHPEIGLAKTKADTYLYRVAGKETLSHETDVWKTFGSDMVIAVRRPEYYGRSDEGFVLETRGSFQANPDGTFMAVGKEGASDMNVMPFYKENELRAVQEFETKFEVQKTSNGMTETYHGEEARQYLAYTMNDDREMYEYQQSGKKPLEFSGLQHISVRYGDTVLMDKDVYMGRMDMGNYRSVKELLADQQPEQTPVIRTALRDAGKGMALREKYSDNPTMEHSIRNFQVLDQEKIKESLQRTFEPEGMEAYKPRVGQKASRAMQWYKAKAQVNYCHTNKEICDYIVADMAAKYKPETIERVIRVNLPELNDHVKESLKRPEVQKIAAQRQVPERKRTQKSREMQR